MATAEDDASPKSYDLNKILAEIDTFDFVKKLPESPAMEAQDTGPLIFLRLFAQLFAMQKHQKAKHRQYPPSTITWTEQHVTSDEEKHGTTGRR